MWKRSQGEQGSSDPYERERGEMIEEQLRRRGVVMHRVLEAMRAVPRHLFVAHEHQEKAYADVALPSEEGQTISQPYMVGVMTQELDVKEGQWVLELGTGTGYQTAVLAKLVGETGKVFTIERVAGLAEGAKRRLGAMGVTNVEFFVGDGTAGWPGDEVGFERILVTAGAPEVPVPLLKQLKMGGVMVVPVGRGETQVLMKVVKRPEGEERTNVLTCKFVPLLGEYGWDLEEYRRARGAGG